jgi:DNA processing protein
MGVLEYVALSLLPLSCRREAAERLRSGEPAADILDRLSAGDRAAALGALTARAQLALTRGLGRGLTPVVWDDARYPVALAATTDPPPVLWTRGVAEVLARPAVAIVGSRAGSPYALAVAERLASDLAVRGVIVVSGLARGVDSAAHRGALRGGGQTVAVLGSGADVIYPPEHRRLASEVQESGAVVSELVPGTPPRRLFFPLRNRIISGLSRAVVVVEAGARSGSLITARLALDQGREVMAVPGNVLTGRNRGAHALLRDGAKPVETADDIAEELQLLRGPSTQHRSASEPTCDPVLAALRPGEAADLDAIAAQCGLSTARLLPRLFELELQGLVGRAGGGRFVRFDRSC